MFTILCPTDFSEEAQNAALYAAEMAKSLKGRLHLTHLLYPTYIGLSEGGFVADVGLEDFLTHSNKRLNELAQHFEKDGVEVTVSTEYGFWDGVLKDLQERIRPDLVVSGTRGVGSVLAAKFFGMNTMTMIKKMECPVLAVPPRFRFSKLDNIVYATDYQFEDVEHALLVAQIAGIQKAKIHFVHIATQSVSTEEDRAYMGWFKELVEKQITYPNKEFSIVVDKDVEESVEFFAFNENVDMLCVSMREKSALGQLFTHSHTQRFLANAVMPILVFHVKENFKM